MNSRLFVANKPQNISSNRFLSQLKKKYGVKKAGFSGTLDPFASGALIVAFGNYTKLFSYLKTSPKIYEATIWLGASSPSLDNENIQVSLTKPLEFEVLKNTAYSLQGKIEYTPPKFSAKKIDGQRAYRLARNGIDFTMKKSTMEIFDIKILNYLHPFLSLQISVSSGSYIRSWAEIFVKKLGINGTLSSLKRISEGGFIFKNEKPLDPLEFLGLEKNSFLGDEDMIAQGKQLSLDKFKIQKNGRYLAIFENFFSIIEIENKRVTYCLNKVEYADID